MQIGEGVSRRQHPEKCHFLYFFRTTLTTVMHYRADCDLRTTTPVNGKVRNTTPAPSETPEPIVTKICMSDYVAVPYPYAKRLHPSPTPQICEKAHQVTRLHRFSRSVRQMTRFRARMCLLGSRKQNFTFRPHFSAKKSKFLANFRRNFKNFASKGLNNGDASL